MASSLPEDILIRVLEVIDLNDLKVFILACKRFYDLSNERSIWVHHYEREFLQRAHGPASLHSTSYLKKHLRNLCALRAKLKPRSATADQTNQPNSQVNVIDYKSHNYFTIPSTDTMKINIHWTRWTAGRLLFALDYQLHLYCFDLDRDCLMIWKREKPITTWLHDDISIHCGEIKKWDGALSSTGDRDVGVMQIWIILVRGANIVVSLALTVEYVPTDSCEEILLGEVGMEVHQLEAIDGNYPYLRNVAISERWLIHPHQNGLGALEIKTGRKYDCPLPTRPTEFRSHNIGIIDDRYFYFFYGDPSSEHFAIYPFPVTQTTTQTIECAVWVDVGPTVFAFSYIRINPCNALNFCALMDANEMVLMTFDLPDTGPGQIGSREDAVYTYKRLPLRSEDLCPISTIGGAGTHFACYPSVSYDKWVEDVMEAHEWVVGLIPVPPNRNQGDGGWERDVIWLKGPSSLKRRILSSLTFDDFQGRMFCFRINEINLISYV